MFILADKNIKIRLAGPMKMSFLKHTHPFLQILFMVFLMLASFLIFSFLGTLLAVPLFHVNLLNLANLMNDMGNPGNVRVLKYLQAVQSVSLFMVPPFLFIFFYGENSTRFFGFNRGATSYAWLAIVFMMFFLIPVNNFLAQWNGNISFPESLAGLEKVLRNMENKADNLTKIFLKMNGPESYIINMLIIAIIPALGEELTFRGIFQPLFIRWTKNIHAGILITGFFFSFFHFQFFGFFPRWLLGVLFGYLYYWSGTIWVPVLAHFINNGLAVTAYWIMGTGNVEKLDQLGVSGQDLTLYAGLLVVALSLYVFYRNTQAKGKRPIDTA